MSGKSKKRRLGPADVLSWIHDCINEAEAGGYEMAEAVNSLGDNDCEWYSDDGVPTVEWVAGGTMMVSLPDGSKVRVKVSRVRPMPTGG